MKTPGLFLAVEGMDGVGKSTLIRGIAERIRSSFGVEANIVYDPGTTAFGNEFRAIIKDAKRANGIAPVTEFLAFCASRRQLMEELILPALAKDQLVISDRFIPSTYAYQGLMGGVIDIIGLDNFATIVRCGMIRQPDIYIRLRASVKTVKARLSGSNDAFDARPQEYFEKLSRAYSDAFTVYLPSQVTRIETWTDGITADEVLDDVARQLCDIAAISQWLRKHTSQPS